jgi:DNA-binding transcriptional LysR family regulator
VKLLQNLQIFVLAAESGNFSTAAKRLGITPAAVSKSVGRLEQELGVRLFNRTTRQFSLTADGRTFYETTRRTVGELSVAIEQLNSAHDEPSGLIRLLMAPSFARLYVLPLLKEFLALHGGIKLSLGFQDGAAIPGEPEFDIGIQRGTPKHVRYISKRICRLPLILVASPAYLAEFGVPKSPADLRSHNCMNVRYASGAILVWRLIRRSTKERYLHHPDNQVLFTEQLDAIIDAAACGLGIAPVAATSVLSQLRNGLLNEVLPDWRFSESLDMFLQYPRRKHLAARVDLLASFLLQRLRGLPELQQRE